MESYNIRPACKEKHSTCKGEHCGCVEGGGACHGRMNMLFLFSLARFDSRGEEDRERDGTSYVGESKRTLRIK